MNLALIPIFLVLGAAVGFMSGLLGIGGGFTIVRVLNVQSECLLRGVYDRREWRSAGQKRSPADESEAPLGRSMVRP